MLGTNWAQINFTEFIFISYDVIGTVSDEELQALISSSLGAAYPASSHNEWSHERCA